MCGRTMNKRGEKNDDFGKFIGTFNFSVTVSVHVKRVDFYAYINIYV